MPKQPARFAILLAAMSAMASAAAAADAPPVLTYHNDAARSGNFVAPRLTWERARSLQPDAKFDARFPGHVYAQPLYWHPPGTPAAMLLVATEDNAVHALDGETGREIWSRTVGKPVPRSALSCGNIDPLGITGTPVIDEQSRAIYVAAAVEDSGVHHRIFALSLAGGAPLPGWPVDVGDALLAQRQSFTPRDQGQRGALAIVNGVLYVPYGGHFGDCGRYFGWVVGVPLAPPRKLVAWSTRGRGGGIWAPGGVSSDGHDLFVATGNTIDVSTWSDGEAVIRLLPDLGRSDRPQDFFTPEEWRTLDDRDADLGATNALPLDLPDAGGTQALLFALSKHRHAYLLDRRNLGGIGGALVDKVVAARPVRTVPAVFAVKEGVFVAFQGEGADCPIRRSDNNLTVLKVAPGSPPSVTTAWCGALRGAGAPIVTTTDGHANPIVWILGAEGDNRLHGFRGDTGEPLFTGESGASFAGLHHSQSLIAAGDRLYVAADGRVYAFLLSAGVQ
jgi:hypothetical protein